MNGLRVILPGVQVLFAFLLTVPFTQRFDEITSQQRDVYFAAFVCTAIASIFLIAPSSYHRLRWRQRDKEHLLRTANIFAIVGIIFLGIAVSAAVFLVTDVMFGARWAAVVAGAFAALLTWCWVGLPLWRRLKDFEESEAEARLIVPGNEPDTHEETPTKPVR